jgi:hypothetical protein
MLPIRRESSWRRPPRCLRYSSRCRANDVYGTTMILMAVASLVAIRVSRHRVHTDHICIVGFTTAIRRTSFRSTT